MKYIFIVSGLIPTIYLLSFARYCWKDNKLSAVGSVILAFLSVVLLSIVIIFIKP